MKTSGLLLACFFSTAALLPAQSEERARTLVSQAVDRIYSSQFARLWESFSDASKSEYRALYQDRLSATRTSWKPDAKKPSAGGLDFRWESDNGGRVETSPPKKPWERELEERGFSPDLDSVKAVGDRDFWETFLSEQYLEDSEYHAPTAPVAPLSSKTIRPTFEVESVATEGDRFYVIIKAQPGLEQAFLALTQGSRMLYPAGGKGFIDHPSLRQRRIVWSGTVEHGIPKLDVPEVVLASEQNTAIRYRLAK